MPISVERCAGRAGCLALIALLAARGAAQAAGAAPPDAPDAGEALYRAHCAHCHDGGVARAPHRITFEMLGARAIYTALTEGVMRVQAQALNDAQRLRLAQHLGGNALAENLHSAVLRCDAPADRGGPSFGDARLRGWGFTLENTRFQSAARAGLSAQDVPELQLKWAFAFPGATRARSQPTLADDTVFVGSQSGHVYALDLHSGCARWIFQADREVRSSPVVSASSAEQAPALYFGDFAATVYKLDARDGALLWRRRVGEHPAATITGSPRVHAGTVYVPLSSTEWASAADPQYPCCSFRGAVVALSAGEGQILWKTHSIPTPPRATGQRNAHNVARLHPAGAPIWNSPTIDTARGLLYVGTGEAYTSPAHGNSDAVIAMDLDSGAIRWRYQALAGDAWNLSCFLGRDRGNCPEEDGPDLDIGAPPVLWRGKDGREILLVGQKSGVVHALDPDDNGALLWRRKVGRGGFAGGIHWGMAADRERLYVPNADTNFIGRFSGERKPGLFALDPLSGATLWHTPAGDHCAQEDKPACDPGLSAAVSVIPGVVFAGGFDGMLKAYAADSGEVIWSFNTHDRFVSVSGQIAQGGSIESDGPVIHQGHVLINSGYLFGGRMPGNALLVFAPHGD